ncbi:hypothetical protein BJX64DRAFT_36535 [Aspergillus heterothallicus]
MRYSPQVEDDIAPSLAEYSVACISPLGVECAAVEAMLDEIHEPLSTGRDCNAYTFGRIGHHNVVVTVMPEMGNNAAATTATAGFGGVVQYDLGKKLLDGNFQRIGHLNKPPGILSSNVRKLQAQHYRVPSKITSYLDEAMQRYPKMQENYRHPGLDCDQLFCWDYVHQDGPTCDQCDREQTVPRAPRRTLEPRIHYGTIGSANMVVKDAITRNQLKRDTRVLCVEMEAAGLMDTFPCLVI